MRKFILGHRSAGLYISQDKAVYWDGKNTAGEMTASGIYFYSIQAGEFQLPERWLSNSKL